MWPDNETAEDFIGFSTQAELIAEVVLDPKVLPVTIGVFGDWGSGKSSIMQMLHHRLNPKNDSDAAMKTRLEKVAVLYFNGWLFEGYDDAKSAILSAVLTELAEHERFGPKVCDAASKLVKRVNWMRVVRLGLSEVAMPAIAAYVSGGLTAIPSLASAFGTVVNRTIAKTDAMGKDAEEAKNIEAMEATNKLVELVKDAPDEGGPSDVRSFRRDFEEMLKKSDIETLVVLVDDLDRCSPERIIDNLEAIKLFLNVERTAFIIGADPRIVRHAIRCRYPQDGRDAGAEPTGDRNERLVDDYLEKLIQMPYHLPPLSRSEIETYMALLFCQRELSAEAFQQCLNACRRAREKNRYGSFGFEGVRSAIGGSLQDSLTGSLTLCAGMADMITDVLKGNPRQVKRFLNMFLLRKRLALAAKLDGIRDDVLLKIMLLEYTEENRFRDLSAWAGEEDGFPKKLREMEESENAAATRGSEEKPLEWPKDWDTRRTKRWLSLPPLLTEVDLRDYFWLTRDRLGSTLSHINLVSPVVQRIFNGLRSDGTRRASAQQAKALPPDELSSLHTLLAKQIQRNPADKKNYDQFTSLLNEEVDSLADYVSVLMTLPVGKMPAAVVLDLLAFSKKHSSGQVSLAPVFAKIEKEPNTKAGRSLLQSQTKK